MDYSLSRQDISLPISRTQIDNDSHREAEHPGNNVHPVEMYDSALFMRQLRWVGNLPHEIMIIDADVPQHRSDGRSYLVDRYMQRIVRSMQRGPSYKSQLMVASIGGSQARSSGPSTWDVVTSG